MGNAGRRNNRRQQTQPAPRKNFDSWKTFWKWVYKLRSVILAIPVSVAAAFLAIYNMATLPRQVGINLLASGEYAYMVGREVAVFGPLILTGICMLLMFCSKRVLYPWLISLFSLVLPLLILITNIFPG